MVVAILFNTVVKIFIFSSAFKLHVVVVVVVVLRTLVHNFDDVHFDCNGTLTCTVLLIGT